MISGSNKSDGRYTDPFDNHHHSSLFNELYTPPCRFSMRFVIDKETAEDILETIKLTLDIKVTTAEVEILVHYK
jgi:hypothetical protein